MTQRNNQEVWAAPLAQDLKFTTDQLAIDHNAMPYSDAQAFSYKKEKRNGRLLKAGSATVLAGTLALAACGSNEGVTESDILKSDAYQTLEAEFTDIEELVGGVIKANTELKAANAALKAENEELRESEDAVVDVFDGSVIAERVEQAEGSSEISEVVEETDAKSDTETVEATESEVSTTLEEQIKSNISKMSDKELLETYAFFDNPQWSEDAREVGLMREVSHEQMVELIRHDRDVLGQIAGCFNYVENNDVKVNNLGEVCAGPEMVQGIKDAMNTEIQRLLEADLDEVAFTAEMVIAKLHGGTLTMDIDEFYKLTQYSGTYNTTRLENREDTIEGSTNTRYNDTWITFGNVTLENGEKYEISFRACGQIVFAVDNPETPETPTTPETPETPEEPEEPENPDHKPGERPINVPPQPVDPTDGVEPGETETNEESQGHIEDGDPDPNNGEPTDNGTQIDGTEGTGAQGPQIGENGDGVTESPDPETSDETDGYDPNTENSEGMDGGNADPEETEAGGDDDEVDTDGDGVGDDTTDGNNGDPSDGQPGMGF